MNIKENLTNVKNKITRATTKAGRLEDSVKLVAVSKFHTIEEIEQAINCGQKVFGENRVQEAKEKFSVIFQKYPDVQLEIIGSLQRNKVKDAVKIATCIQSVDRLELLEEIEKQCAKINKTIDVLFEIHTGEESKSGFTDIDSVTNVLNLFEQNAFPHIIPKGFMTMAPFTEDQELIRKSFITLKNYSIKLEKAFPKFNLKELSMGMSNDFELAIQEGATIVRVGTSIFGQRNYN